MMVARAGWLLVAVWALVAGVSPDARANLGEVDATFGRNGVVRTNFGWGGRGSVAQVLLRQSDGKIVAGAAAWDEGPAFALVRYLGDGSVDPSFGEDGRAVTQIGDDLINRPGVSDVAQQADGKLVAIGEASGHSGPNFAVVRYEADGTVDATFGEAGVVVVTSDEYDEPRAVAVRPDGRIVVAGTRYADSGDLRITSLLPDGTPDASFGIGGQIAVDLGGEEWVSDMVLQDDGRIVLSGAYDVGEQSIALYGVLADGTLDPSFGVGGIVTTVVGSRSEARAAILQGDGRIVVTGYGRHGVRNDVVVARYLADGTPDATFGIGGVVVTPLPGDTAEIGYDVAQAPDGRLAVVANVSGTPRDRQVVLRYELDGRLDGGFTSESPGPSAGDYFFEAVAVQDDGRIVAGGAFYGALASVALVRYDDAGTLDDTFGAGGLVLTAADKSDDWMRALMLQADGRIVMVGSAQTAYVPNVAVVRLLADGSPDPSFGDAGRVVTVMDEQGSEAVDVVEQPGGKLVVAVRPTGSSGARSALVRYAADGSVDVTFGPGGAVETLLLTGGVGGLVQQSDGKLVVIGTILTSGQVRVTLARHHPDGALDTSFGVGGTVTGGIGYAETVLVQPDDRIVVGGTSGTALILERFLANGGPDPSFGINGRTAFGASGTARWFSGIALQANGKIVGASGGAVTRVTSAGVPDATFSSNGVAPGPLQHFAALPLPDGSVLGAGNAWVGNSDRFGLVHYFVDGSVDYAFGDAGVGHTRTGGRWSTIKALRAQPDGRVLAAGDADSDFALVRYFTRACGNGRVDPGEQCDAGFVADACCNAQCQWADSGTTCDDGDPCTQDACTVGVGCLHTGGPRTSCRAAGASQLVWKNEANDGRDRLLWKWQRGAAVAPAELGVPTTTTDYGLCIYAGSGTASAAMPAGAGWRRAGNAGFSYKQSLGLPHGIRKVSMKHGDAGRSSALVDGKGIALPDVPMPVQLPLRVQLVSDETGACFEAVYETALRNDGSQLRVKRR